MLHARPDYNRIQDPAKLRLTAEEANDLVPTIPPVPAPTPRRPAVVTICGSSRFIEEVASKAWQLEKEGKIVLSMHLLPAGRGHPEHHAAEAEGVAHILDELHLRKIDISDFIFVMNVGGYVGERTAIEIEYARNKGIPVHYLNEGMAGR